VLTGGKPTQSARFGECAEGLPGSTKSAGCVERSIRDLGGPAGSWGDELGTYPPLALGRRTRKDK
jgi:hypothetical protein